MPKKNKALIKKNVRKPATKSPSYEFKSNVRMLTIKDNFPTYFPAGTKYKVSIGRYGEAVYTIKGKKYIEF